MPTSTPRMTLTTFQQWCRALQLSQATSAFLAMKRASEPEHRMTSRATNMSSYPSSKMGVTIQYESEHVELWAILVMDHDPEVLEFYYQPHTFKIQYLGKSGQRMESHFYTPDFLVLRKTPVCFEEWKTEADHQRLAQHYPARYQQQEDGSWRCPPAETVVESAEAASKASVALSQAAGTESIDADKAASPTKPKCTRRVGEPKPHHYPVGERESDQQS